MADAEPHAASTLSDADKRAIVDRFLKENGELVAQIPGNKTKVKLFAKVVEIEVQLEIARRMAKDQSAEIGDALDEALAASAKQAKEGKEIEAELADAWQETDGLKARIAALEQELEVARATAEADSAAASSELRQSQALRTKLEEEIGALRDAATLAKEKAQTTQSEFEAALALAAENTAAEAAARAAAETDLEEHRARSESEAIDQSVALEESKNTRAKIEQELGALRDQTVLDGEAATAKISDLEAALSVTQENAAAAADAAAAAADDKLDAALAAHSALSAKLEAVSAEAAAQLLRADGAEQRAMLAESEVGDANQRASALETQLAEARAEIETAQTQAQERVAAETERANAAELEAESLQANLTAAQAALTNAAEESAAQLDKLNERVRGLTLDLAVAKKAGEQAAAAAAKEVRQAREQSESLEAKLAETTAERDAVAAKVEAAETDAAAQRAEAERAAQNEAAAVAQRDHALAEADSIATAFSAFKANDQTPHLREAIERLKQDLHEASQALQFADLHPTLPFAEIKLALAAGLATADGPAKQFGEQLHAAVVRAEADLHTVRAKVDGGNGSVAVIVELGALQSRAELLSEHARAFATLVG